jgi:hypothetical protein
VSRKDSLAGTSLRNLIYILFTLENYGSNLLQNTGNQLLCDRVSVRLKNKRILKFNIFLPALNNCSHCHLLLQTAQISNQFRSTNYDTYTDLYVPYANLTSHQRGVYYVGTICTVLPPVTLKP